MPRHAAPCGSASSRTARATNAGPRNATPPAGRRARRARRGGGGRRRPRRRGRWQARARVVASIRRPSTRSASSVAGRPSGRSSSTTTEGSSSSAKPASATSADRRRRAPRRSAPRSPGTAQRRRRRQFSHEPCKTGLPAANARRARTSRPPPRHDEDEPPLRHGLTRAPRADPALEHFGAPRCNLSHRRIVTPGGDSSMRGEPGLREPQVDLDVCGSGHRDVTTCAGVEVDPTGP